MGLARFALAISRALKKAALFEQAKLPESGGHHSY